MNVPMYLAAVALAVAAQAVAYLLQRPRDRLEHWFAAGNYLGAWTLYAIFARAHPAHYVAGAVILLAAPITLHVLAAWERHKDLSYRLADLEEKTENLRLRVERHKDESQRGAGRGA
jgi:hypothetical protein